MKVEYLVVADMADGITNTTTYPENQFKKAVADFKDLLERTELDVELKMRMITVHKETVMANRGTPDLPF